jgi:hypothetical protein
MLKDALTSARESKDERCLQEIQLLVIVLLM